MAAAKSEMKSEMAHLTGKIENIQSEMTHLNNNLTTQMRSFVETVSELGIRKIIVAVVDGYQGKENHIIILD